MLQEGKDSRAKYGHREHNPDAGVTNKVKQKKKNFQMVKHKLNNTKGKRSFRDKQVGSVLGDGWQPKPGLFMEV